MSLLLAVTARACDDLKKCRWDCFACLAARKEECFAPWAWFISPLFEQFCGIVERESERAIKVVLEGQWSS